MTRHPESFDKLRPWLVGAVLIVAPSLESTVCDSWACVGHSEGLHSDAILSDGHAEEVPQLSHSLRLMVEYVALPGTPSSVF